MPSRPNMRGESVARSGPLRDTEPRGVENTAVGKNAPAARLTDVTATVKLRGSPA